MEVEIQRPDGERKIIEETIYPIPTNSGYRLGSIVRDITKRRRVEQELRAAYEQISASNEEL